MMSTWKIISSYNLTSLQLKKFLGVKLEEQTEERKSN